MGELEPELNADEYDERINELAQEMLVVMTNEAADFRDAYEVFDFTLGGFYEEYPVSVLEHSPVDATDSFPSQYAHDTTDPFDIVEIRAHAVLAKDLSNRMEQLFEESSLVEFDGEGFVLSEEGKSLLNSA